MAPPPGEASQQQQAAANAALSLSRSSSELGTLADQQQALAQQQQRQQSQLQMQQLHLQQQQQQQQQQLLAMRRNAQMQRQLGNRVEGGIGAVHFNGIHPDNKIEDHERASQSGLQANRSMENGKGYSQGMDNDGNSQIQNASGKTIMEYIPPSHPQHSQHARWLQQQEEQQQDRRTSPPQGPYQQQSQAVYVRPAVPLQNGHPLTSAQGHTATVQGRPPLLRVSTSFQNSGQSSPPPMVVRPSTQPPAVRPFSTPLALSNDRTQVISPYSQPPRTPTSHEVFNDDQILYRRPSVVDSPADLRSSGLFGNVSSASSTTALPGAGPSMGPSRILGVYDNMYSPRFIRAPPPLQNTNGPIGHGSENYVAAKLALNGGPLIATASAVGPALSKIIALNEYMALAMENDHLESFRSVVANHFTETGIVKYRLYDKSAQLSKSFEIPCSALPQFQYINSICGVLQQSLNPHFVREFFLTTIDPSSNRPVHVGYLLKADETCWNSRFSNGTKVDMIGTLLVHFVVTALPNGAPGGLRIECMDFDSRGYDEYVLRDAVVTEHVKKWHDVAPQLPGKVEPSKSTPVAGPPSKKSTKKGANAASGGRRRSSANRDDEDEKDKDRIDRIEKQQQAEANKKLGNEETPGTASFEYETNMLPLSPIGSFGVTEMGLRCLEIAESVSQLQDLMRYSLETGAGPLESLARYSSNVDNRDQLSSASSAADLSASTAMNGKMNEADLAIVDSAMPPPYSINRLAQPGSSTGTKRKALGDDLPPRTPTPGRPPLSPFEQAASKASMPGVTLEQSIGDGTNLNQSPTLESISPVDGVKVGQITPTTILSQNSGRIMGPLPNHSIGDYSKTHPAHHHQIKHMMKGAHSNSQGQGQPQGYHPQQPQTQPQSTQMQLQLRMQQAVSAAYKQGQGITPLTAETTPSQNGTAHAMSSDKSAVVTGRLNSIPTPNGSKAGANGQQKP